MKKFQWMLYIKHYYQVTLAVYFYSGDLFQCDFANLFLYTLYQWNFINLLKETIG